MTDLVLPIARREGRMPDKAAEYRKRADECRGQARSTQDMQVQRQYLELAEGWLKLALQVEQQQRGFNESEE